MLSSFKDLLAATGTPANAGRGILDALRERLLPSLKWRQAQLINKLYERRHAGDYAESARAMAKGRPVLRVLVMGGGAIGLRCAVELALLGHSVLALEQRRSFTRLTLRSGGVQSRTRDACRHRISARFAFGFRSIAVLGPHLTAAAAHMWRASVPCKMGCKICILYVVWQNYHSLVYNTDRHRRRCRMAWPRPRPTA